jgi:DNA-binding transcriptional ArsR family regulator
MAGTDRDLVAALRAELAAVDPSRACDRTAEIAGLGPRPVTREGTVARLIVRLGGRAADGVGAAGVASGLPHPPGHAAHASHVRRTFVLPPAELDWATAHEHCRLAWLRGRFLARGSLSLSGGRAHLEFVVPAAEAADLAGRLADVGLPASWRLRRGLGVVTWSAESIAQFLGRIGASASLLELEARSVARSLRGELNRVINAESANLQRSVEAAGRQLAAIDALEADGRLQEQPRTVRAVAEARRETPEASLSEIAARMDLHRSAVQRALDRVERLALHDDEGVGQRRPTGHRTHAAARG